MQLLDDPEDVRVALIYFRVLHGWNQAEMAKHAGVNKSLISLYEQGKQEPSEKSLRRLLAALEIPVPAFQEILGFVRLFRSHMDHPGEGPDRLAAAMGHLTAAAAHFVVSRHAAAAYHLGSDPDALPEEARADAEDLRERLEGCSREDQELLIRELPEFQDRDLCQRLCAESARVAKEDAERATEVAGLAIEVASRVPVKDNRRLQGYAWAHLAHARRAAGDLPGADEAFARARELWEAGAPDPADSVLSGRFLNLLVH